MQVIHSQGAVAVDNLCINRRKLDSLSKTTANFRDVDDENLVRGGHVARERFAVQAGGEWRSHGGNHLSVPHVDGRRRGEKAR